jgi:PKD repeat protein
MNDQVVHLAPGGTELWRGGGFAPKHISVNPTDGSCWIASETNNDVVHLAENGDELLRLRTFDRPLAVSVNTTDGSCWVADSQHHQVVHIAENGTELWRSTSYSFIGPISVSVNRANGSCWVVDADLAVNQVIHLSATGAELSRTDVATPRAVSVNPTDGSCWVSGVAKVTHLSSSGAKLWEGPAAAWSSSLSANPTDGSCWVADTYHIQVVHLAQTGAELLRWGFREPNSVSVNSTDGSCWLTDRADAQLVHLRNDGKQLLRLGFPTVNTPYAVSVNSTDGSVWVADTLSMEVVHLAANGSELSRSGGFNTPEYLSVNTSDGSCWVADGLHNQVVHLAQNGNEIWRGGTFSHPKGVSVDPTDGSCWVANWDGNEIVHLAESGSELWRGGGFANPVSVAVDANDGSCWVANTYADQVVHLAADGSELWRGGTSNRPSSISVDTTDSSCWLVDAGAVVHLDSNGAELERIADVYNAESICVNIADGTCWVTDTGNHQLVHLGILAAPVADFSATPRTGQAPLAVSFSDESTGPPTSWLWDFGDGQSSVLQNPTHEYAVAGSYTVTLGVANGQGADSETKEAYIVASFSDAPPGYWAAEQIMACVANGIVSGYDDGLYHPDWPVTRDQMAVYISRALAGGDSSVPAFTDTPTFPDVPTGNWALKYVEFAADQGVVTGYEDGTYHPTEQVNRAQMAVYIARAMVAPNGEAGLADYVPSDPRNFPDVASTFWSYKHIEYCVEHGVVAGYEDGLYHPEIVVTRDQMAVYVARAFGL